MKFVLEVDLDQIESDKREPELGRILRYWAGNLKHYNLEPGDGAALSDSDYRPVGEWKITD
jgi:hypothetical protein